MHRRIGSIAARTPALIVVLVPALLALASGAALAGANAGAVLMVHADAKTPVPKQATFVDGRLAVCDSAVVEAPADSNVLWFVYAAFPPGSHPRVKVVTFACKFDPDKVGILWSATRPGAMQIFFPDQASWPNTGSGVAVGFKETLTAPADEIYCFAGYGPKGETFAVVPHPDPNQGGSIADDGVPASTLETVAGYGSLGFGVPGVRACPDGKASLMTAEPKKAAEPDKKSSEPEKKKAP